MTPNNRVFTEFSLTVLSGYDIFYLSPERPYQPLAVQQVSKRRFDNRVNVNSVYLMPRTSRLIIEGCAWGQQIAGVFRFNGREWQGCNPGIHPLTLKGLAL